LNLFSNLDFLDTPFNRQPKLEPHLRKERGRDDGARRNVTLLRRARGTFTRQEIGYSDQKKTRLGKDSGGRGEGTAPKDS